MVIGSSRREDFFELFETYFAVEVDVMLYDHFVYLQSRNLNKSLPFESFCQILPRYVVGIIDIKLFEQRPKLLIRQCLFNREYSGYELRVVDVPVTNIVNLLNNSCYAFILNVEVQFFEGGCELTFADHASFIDVDGYELFAELFSTSSHLCCLVRVLLVTFDLGLADEEVHGSFFKFRGALKVDQILEHIGLKFCGMQLVTISVTAEKIMLQAILGCEALLWIIQEHMTHKIFSGPWNMSKDVIIEFKLTIAHKLGQAVFVLGI